MTLANKHSGSGTRVSEETNRPGYERVAAKIMGLISASNLQPGDRLPTERALSEQLGVSRTVVREAVKALAATGIVRSQQGSGLYLNSMPKPFASAVIDLSMTVEPEQVESLYDFRILLEVRSARQAAERITPRELRQLHEALARNQRSAETGDIDLFHDSDAVLHQGIAEASRNPFLASAVSTVHRLQDWVSVIVIGGTPGSIQVAAEQHSGILAAIQDGNAELAGQRMQQHIETTVANYQQEVRRRLLGESSGG